MVILRRFPVIQKRAGDETFKLSFKVLAQLTHKIKVLLRLRLKLSASKRVLQLIRREIQIEQELL